ncbi:kinase-like protein [Armillaria solidipes]|uniref:non-specific serine/threonine protein kinase n=1 Tax=Armillaria solidipes TaxID=1076256 RepID=A0A2H3BY90_9AGAR|nr:kinase-like protein [Armillaria solidipes]
MQRLLLSSLRITRRPPQISTLTASSQKTRAFVSSVSAANKEDATFNKETFEPSSAWTRHEENQNRYQPGGYHPTQVGDKYASGRYTITGKLGWGEYSTVWLARDNEANMRGSQAPELHELEYFQDLRRQNPGHFGYPNVVHLADSFYIDGPYGKHLCVVTEMAICNLLTLAEECFTGNRIPEYGAKLVMRDVLSALDYVHNDCNIIHTDVKITNVVVTVPRDTSTVIIDHANIYPEACYADKTNEHFTQEVCPAGIRPPEVALRAGWGKSVDIWSAGCMVPSPFSAIEKSSLFLVVWYARREASVPRSV